MIAAHALRRIAIVLAILLSLALVSWRSFLTRDLALPDLARDGSPAGLDAKEAGAFHESTATGASAPAFAARQKSARTDHSGTQRALEFVRDIDRSPAWAVSYGSEFWHPNRQEELPAATATPPSGVQQPPFRLGEVIERVTHAWESDQAGAARLMTGAYEAGFDGGGLTFSPHRPADAAWNSEPAIASAPQSDPATRIRFRTLDVRRGEESHFDSGHPEWLATGNTIQGNRSVQHEIVEHYEAASDGVAVTWVLNRRLPGDGGIEVAASLEGLSYAGASPEGHHFADGGGTARLRVGRATAVDADGNRWELETQVATHQGVQLVVAVPAAILAEAAYPLAIDPVISAEFGVNQPVSAPATASQTAPAVAAGTGQYLVVWTDARNSAVTGNDILGVRISTAGKVLDPAGIAICTTYGAQSSPSAAALGGSFLVVWQDARLGGNDIFAGRITSAGVALDPLGFAVSVAAESQTEPAVAAGPAGFLVVWEDDRQEASTGRDIFGARVTLAGIVSDPAGLEICTRDEEQANATVTAFNGSYFVAWQDERNGSADDIFATRVTATGTVQDPLGISVSVHSGIQTAPAATANATGILVAWQDTRNGAADIFAARISASGAVLDTNGFAVTAATSTQTQPAAAAVADMFLVAWQDNRQGNSDIFAARINSAGVLQETNGIPVTTNATSQTAPALAGGSSGFFLAWADARNSAITGSDILGSRLDPSGVVQDTNSMMVGVAMAEALKPAVAFNGTNYLVVWQDTRSLLTQQTNIYGARVSAVGRVLDPSGLGICTLPGAQMEPAVAASRGTFLVAWEDTRSFGSTVHDIYAARISWDGLVLDPAGLAISTAAHFQAKPTVAANDSTFLVAWEDSRDGVSLDIFCTLVSESGVVANPAGTPVSSASQHEQTPSAASTTNGFLVAWQRSEDIMAARITTTGIVSDPPGSSIRLNMVGSGTQPSVAALGTNYLVVWTDNRNQTDLDIFAGRVGGDGSSPDAGTHGFPVCTLPGDQTAPAAAADDHAFVAIWQNKGFTGTDLLSARISSAGALLDHQSLPAAGSGGFAAPALVYNRSNKFLVFAEAARGNSKRASGVFFTADPTVSSLLVQFGAASYAITENGKFAKIKVALKGKYSGLVTVDFTTDDGTALAGLDYLPLAGRIVFANKKTSATIALPILNDVAAEPVESLALRLTNPTGGAAFGPRHTALLTITDDDD